MLQDLGGGEEHGEGLAQLASHGLGRLINGFRAAGGLSPLGQPGRHGPNQVATDHRLGQVGVGTEVAGFRDVLMIASGAEKKERGPVKSAVGPERRQDPLAIQPWHHLVAQDEVRTLATGGPEAGEPVCRGEHPVAFQLEQEGEIRAEGGLILDDEEGFR